MNSKITKFNKLPYLIKSQKSIIKESLLALIICAIGDLCAGIILGNMTFFLNAFPGLLVIIPGAIGMRGNIFGSFASRLSTNLHIGTLDPEFKFSRVIKDNLKSSLILTMVLSLFLAIFAKLMCILFNLKSISIVDFILISIFAGIISSVVMLPITWFISVKSYMIGWDPDNITTPLVAAFGDLFTLPAIIASIYVLEIFSNSIIKDIILVILVLFIIIIFLIEIKSDDYIKEVLKESTPILIACSFLGVYAGTILDTVESTLLTNPTLLTLIPLFSGESGNIVSILGARLSSGLHSGLFEPEFKINRHIGVNFLITFLLVAIIYPVIAIIAEISSILLNLEPFGMLPLILISIFSGFTLIPIMMFIVFLIGIISFKKGLDPDNIVIPVSTSITDSFSSTILIIYSLIIISMFI